MFVAECLVFFKEIAKASWSGLEFLSILSYAVDFKLRNKIVTSHTRCRHTWLILLNKRMNFGTSYNFRQESRRNAPKRLWIIKQEFLGNVCIFLSHQKS